MNGLLHNAVGHEQVAEQPRVRRGFVIGMIKSPRGIQSLVVIADVLALLVSWAIFYVVRVNSGLFSDIEGFPFWVVLQTSLFVVPLWLFLFWFCGMYVSIHNRALFDEYYSVLKVLLMGFTILLIALYFGTSTPTGDSRSNRFVSMLIYFCLMAGTIAVGRYLVRVAVRRLRRRGIGLRRTIIVGDSPSSRQLLEMFTGKPELGFQIVGTVTTGTHPSPEFARLSLGTVDEIDRIILDSKAEVTVLAMEREREMVPKLMTETLVADTTIKIIPDLYDLVSGQARAQHLYGIPLIEINPRIMPPWEAHLKRLLDISFSLFVLVLGFPVWILTALLVKLEDRGPIFYSQERVGLGGRRFTIHKLRSMRIDAETRGITWTSVNDPRVTRVGRIIRQLHLDEIPQFWNILVGDMSIVGPRPERPFYVEKFSAELPSYPRRLRVKPGLTGWNQVQMDEVVESVEFVQERLRHDFFYIENMSLRLDIEIILRTIIRVLQRKGQA